MFNFCKCQLHRYAAKINEILQANYGVFMYRLLLLKFNRKA